MRFGLLVLSLLLPLALRAAEGGVQARIGIAAAEVGDSLPAGPVGDGEVGVWQTRTRTRFVGDGTPVLAGYTAPSASASVVLLPEVHPFVAGRDSLPQGMPLLGRALWGRHGLVRALGLAPSSRRAELRLRRRMLQTHQKLALVTLGVFTAQVVTGELQAADPAKYHDSLHPVHRTLGYTTFGLYSATASLSIFAPPARRYTPGFDAVDVHRALAAIHFTGMMLMPWLGRRTASGGPDYDRNLAQHRWVGRVTYGAYLGAFATILLAR